MTDILINQNTNIFLIDKNAIVNGFLSCLGIIASLVIMFLGFYFFTKNRDKRKILKNGYLSLLLFETRTCILNAKEKISKIVNNEELEIIYDELFDSFKGYGFFVLNLYKVNKNESNFNFNNLWVPLLVTFLGNLILEISGFSKYKTLCIVVPLIIVSFAMIEISRTDSFNVKKNLLSGDELISLFYKRKPETTKQTEFDLSYLTSEDISFFKKRLGEYLKLIDKIQKIEQEKDILERHINIFNFEDDELKKYYGFKNDEIIIYGRFKKIREKHIIKNAYIL